MESRLTAIREAMTDKQKELAAIEREFDSGEEYEPGVRCYLVEDMVEEIWRLRRELERCEAAYHEQADWNDRLRRDLAYQERLSARWYAVATAGACAECGLGSNGEFCACDK